VVRCVEVAASGLHGANRLAAIVLEAVVMAGFVDTRRRHEAGPLPATRPWHCRPRPTGRSALGERNLGRVRDVPALKPRSRTLQPLSFRFGSVGDPRP